MAGISTERLERYLDGSLDTNPAFWDDFYRPELMADPHRRRWHQVVVAAVTIHQLTGGKPWLYKPDSISGGYRAHEIAREYGLPTIKDIDRTIGSQRHKDDIIAPNSLINFQRARVARDRFAGYAVVEPSGHEQASRRLGIDRLFSGGLRFEEEHFMALWFPVVDQCKAMCLEGDWHFSRNGLWEMFRGVMIQAGLSPLRPHADMEVFDIFGDPLSLVDRAEKVAEYVAYALHHGFKPKEGATVLARLFKLDDWLRSPGAEGNPLNADNIHSSLLNRSAGELARFDRLKADFVPLLQRYCARYMKREMLEADYPLRRAWKRDPVLPAHLVPPPRVGDGYMSLHTSFREEADSGRFAGMAQPGLPFKTYEQDIDYFAPERRAVLFDDDWYNQCSVRERAGLPHVAGAADTILAPASASNIIYISCDFKAGQKARQLSQQFGLVGVAELPGHLGDKFAGEVVVPNRDQVAALQAKLQRDHPDAIVVSDLNFEEIFGAIGRYGEYIAYPGDAKFGPEARLQTRLTFMDRNISDHVVLPGWETSPSEVNKVLRTTLMQMGLVDRPFDGLMPVRLYEAGKTQPLTLFDRAQRLASYVRDCVEAGIDVPEQATALARLFDLYDRVVDHRLNRGVVEINRVHPSLLAYDNAAMKELRDAVRPVLIGTCARYIRTEGLSEDYEFAKRRLLDEELKRKQISPRSELLGWGDTPLI